MYIFITLFSLFFIYVAVSTMRNNSGSTPLIYWFVEINTASWKTERKNTYTTDNECVFNWKHITDQLSEHWVQRWRLWFLHWMLDVILRGFEFFLISIAWSWTARCAKISFHIRNYSGKRAQPYFGWTIVLLWRNWSISLSQIVTTSTDDDSKDAKVGTNQQKMRVFICSYCQ